METKPEKERIESAVQIESIQKCEPPTDMPGNNWYQYVVGHQDNKITGYKSGTLKSVTQHVEAFTEGLNERTTIGYSPSVRASRQKK